MLKRMNRRHGVALFDGLVARLRAARPDIALSSDFIVGHPGETEQAFERLLEFVAEARFDRLSAFRYWDEEGCASALLPDKVPVELAEERLAELMALQQEISLANNQRFVGRRLRVLVEGRDEDSGLMAGRSYRDAPEVDGQVLLRGPGAERLQPGSFVEATIEEALEHDLVGGVPAR